MLDSDKPCPPHWYLIEEPHDGKRLLDSKCKKCGAERQFPASGDDDRTSWHPHIPNLQRAPITYIYEV
jgi:hypothetical protein